MRRIFIFITALTMATALGLTIWAGRSTSSGRSLDQLSIGQGVSVALTTAFERRTFSELRLLAQRGDRSFYRATARDGTPCLAMGFDTEVGSAVCNVGGFPSASLPVLVFPDFEGDSQSPAARLFRVQGFAANGVDRLVVADDQSTIANIPVSQNVFDFTFDPAVATAVVARAIDESGTIMWEQELRSPTLHRAMGN